MPLYTFIHSLLNVLVEIANKMGLKKISFVYASLSDAVSTTDYIASDVRRIRKDVK
jgi:hypothetical protein